jgi:shikimate kinase
MSKEEVPVVQLVGPGGAGKTTVGLALASQLDWAFVDLDREFMAREGDIAGFMAAHGYAGYARRNLAVHAEVRGAFTVPTVYALSSGFMTYSADVDAACARIRGEVAQGALTVLLLPSFELEPCVEAIVKRQLSRPYLPGNMASEEARIRQRFLLFMALQCARFLNDGTPEDAALQIAGFVRKHLEETTR